MKIKVKKEMRLDELIKWARENPDLSQGKIFFQQDLVMDSFVFIQIQISVQRQVLFPIDIPFIVDIEKEVTEETKVDRLIELFEIQEGDYNSTLYENTSIKECLYGRCVPTKAFYILNDDLNYDVNLERWELLV